MNDSHKEVLNGHKVEILKKMARHVKETGVNEVPLSVLRDNINDYNNAQKLRYHALIFKVKRGTWGLTSHGVAFLRGEKDLNKHVYISNNKIIAKSDEMVNIRDIVVKPNEVAQEFEYLEGGRRVVRPRNDSGQLEFAPQAVSWLNG